ncbi:MAG: ribonuclease P protein component [Pirellulales bacterium]|nr:ribonuclease P protein component [Pirellulales bacterium]
MRSVHAIDATMSDESFRPHEHLRRHADFVRVYTRRRRAGDERMLVYACENGLAYTRLGLSVSRRVGNAVVRNRWKRLVREIFRRHRPRLPVGIDLVVVAHPGSEPCLADLTKSLLRLAKNAAARLEKN